MTFVHWMEQSYFQLKTDGVIEGAQKAARELYLGARHRLHWIRFLTSNLQSIEAAGIDATLRQDTKTEFLHYRNFRNEEKLVSDVIRQTGENDVFWDIGANIGTYSCLVGQVGKKVYAFEPYPRNRRKLRLNFELNDLEPHNVLEYALANTNGESVFSVDSRLEAGSGQGSLLPEGGSETIPVECRRGDDLMEQGFPAPDVMKVDVEGVELEVLRGFTDAIATGKIRLIYCEVHSTEWDDLRAFIEGHGYTIEVLHESAKQAFIRASRPR